MALAVADIGPAQLDSLGPSVEIELTVEVHIAPAQADALAINARKIGLAANPAAVAAIERVIPDVQLVNRRRVHGGDEVAHAVRNVDQVLIGADAVHRGHDIVGQFSRRADVKAPAAVSEADDGPLPFGP